MCVRVRARALLTGLAYDAGGTYKHRFNMTYSPAGGITAPLSRRRRQWVVWFEFCELTVS